MHRAGKTTVLEKALNKRSMALCLGLAVLAAPPLHAEEPATAASEKTERQFNIESQPLYSALSRLAEQSGLQFVYTPDLVKGKASPGVAGRYTAAEALRRVLEGSGLGYRFGGANTIVLERPAEPLGNRSGHPQTLPPLTVRGNTEYDSADPYNPDYNRTVASTATKTDTPIMETPLSIQVVPKAIINDQQAIRVGDALRNVSGYFDSRGEEFVYDTA
jgi:iron complex outermembrane receptor protein